MRIQYLGPSGAVNVAPYGSHRKNEVKSYPDEFGRELLATSRKQQFAEFNDASVENIAEMPVAAKRKPKAKRGK